MTGTINTDLIRLVYFLQTFHQVASSLARVIAKNHGSRQGGTLPTFNMDRNGNRNTTAEHAGDQLLQVAMSTACDENWSRVTCVT